MLSGSGGFGGVYVFSPGAPALEAPKLRFVLVEGLGLPGTG